MTAPHAILRTAAAKAREAVEAVDGGVWYVSQEAPDVLPDVIAECSGESCDGCGTIASMVAEEVAAYIALAGPPLMVAVADWLARVADDTEAVASDLDEQQAALNVARIILGGGADE